MFAGVQKYMAENGEAPTGAAKVELVQKLLHQVREAPATLLIGGLMPHFLTYLTCFQFIVSTAFVTHVRINFRRDGSGLHDRKCEGCLYRV